MACLTLVYVLATFWLVWLARSQLKHATELERSRTRPFVLFDLIVDRHYVFAQVTNTGQTSARDIRVTVSPQIESLLGGPNAYPREERSTPISFLERGIAMIAPGRSITGLVAHWSRFHSAYPTLRFEGSVTYSAAGHPIYTETFVIDLTAHEGLRYLGTKDIQDVARQLESISRTLENISTGFSRPLVRTIAEAEYIAEQEAFIAQAQQSSAQEQPSETQGPPAPSSGA